jgi:hypothetical protein
MLLKTINHLTNRLKPSDHRKIWEWAESDEGINFANAPSYDCNRKSPFRISLLPFYKQILDDVLDKSVKEIVLVKNTRAGGSLTILETVLRYTIAVAPKSCLYITGSLDACNSFFRNRIVKGMKLSPAVYEKFLKAKTYDTTIDFEDMRFRSTFPGASMFGKADSYDIILGDEVSCYFNPDAIDALRTRQATVPFGKIILISSPDTNTSRNSMEDPIFISYAKTNQCEWYCKDPVTGSLFTFKMGKRGGDKPGLKIDQDAKNPDGTWNMGAVRRGTYYLTPDKTRIYEKDRLAVVATGKWVSTVKDPASIEPGRNGYRVNAFMMPWFSFGDIASKFIEATNTSQSELRSFVFNYLGEEWYQSKIELRGNEILMERCGNYNKNDDILSINEYKDAYKKIIDEYKVKFPDKKNPVKIVTCDVQKNLLFVATRLWFSNGSSHLLDWKKLVGFPELVDYVDTVKPSWAGLDVNYYDRKIEALDVAYKHRMIPMIGSKEGMKEKIQIREVNVYEGTKWANKGKKIQQVTFDTYYFKGLLFELFNATRNNKWYLYNNIEQEYLNMLNSEKFVDGKWIEKSPINHALDLENMQLALAYHLGFLTPTIGV